MLDELAHAGPEHLDAGYVAGYEAKAGVDTAAEVDLLCRHGLGPHSTLLDIGAGTGAVAIAAAPRCGRVIAVDVSPAMLAVARRAAAAAGVTNVEFVQAGFLSYDHQGDPVDVVHSRHALHQLPDFWKGLALARLAAVLRPGGMLRLRDLAYSFEPHQAAERLDAWLATAATDTAPGRPASRSRPGYRTHRPAARPAPAAPPPAAGRPASAPPRSVVPSAGPFALIRTFCVRGRLLRITTRSLASPATL
jgi:SAM-dependent methyltransferase